MRLRGNPNSQTVSKDVKNAVEFDFGGNAIIDRPIVEKLVLAIRLDANFVVLELGKDDGIVIGKEGEIVSDPQLVVAILPARHAGVFELVDRVVVDDLGRRQVDAADVAGRQSLDKLGVEPVDLRTVADRADIAEPRKMLAIGFVLVGSDDLGGLGIDGPVLDRAIELEPVGPAHRSAERVVAALSGDRMKDDVAGIDAEVENLARTAVLRARLQGGVLRPTRVHALDQPASNPIESYAQSGRSLQCFKTKGLKAHPETDGEPASLVVAVLRCDRHEEDGGGRRAQEVTHRICGGGR